MLLNEKKLRKIVISAIVFLLFEGKSSLISIYNFNCFLNLIITLFQLFQLFILIEKFR